MEIFEILKDQLYQSGAPEGAAVGSPSTSGTSTSSSTSTARLDPEVPTTPNSILYIYWPILDSAELPDLSILDALTDIVVRLIRDGHRVLVHCHRGKSRSGLFNALVAMKILQIDGETAVELIRERRPGALGNQIFVEHLQRLPAPTKSTNR
jgi:protein-tyrosine phosphatase